MVYRDVLFFEATIACPLKLTGKSTPRMKTLVSPHSLYTTVHQFLLFSHPVVP